MNNIVFPVSIDCGAVSTGVFLPVSRKGILVDIQSGELKLSQQDRTSKRHQRRAAKRRKLAKRLFVLMLRQYNIDFFSLEPNIREFLSGLLNKRGYTFYGSENKNIEIIKETEPDFFSSFCKGIIKPDVPLTTQLEVLSRDQEQIRELALILEDKYKAADDKKAKAKDDEKLTQEQKKAIKALGEIVKDISEAKSSGHLYRVQYLENILKDIAGNAVILSPLYRNGLDENKLYRLIGNISNLQLRFLRKYFNNPQWKTEKDELDAPRFFNLFSRYIASWHPGNEDKERAKRRAVLDIIKKYDESDHKTPEIVLHLLMETDPVLTIPPYEDQNNRRLTPCQSLLLNEEYLNEKYPGWKKYLKLADCESHVNVELKSNLEYKNKNSQLLQRMFDINSRLDGLKIRTLADMQQRLDQLTDKDKYFRQEHLDKIKTTASLTDGEALEFIRMAGEYYEECRKAASGDWTAGSRSILKLCGKNPPHKSKHLHILISNLLSFKADEKDCETLVDYFKKTKAGRRGMKGFAELCAKAQKDYGVTLKEELRSNKEDKNLKDILKDLDSFGVLLKNWVNDRRRERGLQPVDRNFADVFIFLQLYNLLFTDLSGFSSTCRCCSVENAWRTEVKNYQGYANAKRLPADSTRPFDGVLARAIDRIAWETASAVINELKTQPEKTQVLIPIILETNQFEFTQDVLALKGKSAKKEPGTGFMEKAERIKADSKGVCPYTGNTIGEDGHIDHIVPRAYTKKLFNTVINSEANLIYASKKGNTDKTDRIYTLNNLNKEWLLQVLKTSDLKEVESRIKENWEKMKNSRNRNLGAFHSFTEEERILLRLSLFVDDLRNEVLREINFINKSKVNGVQKFLARSISSKLHSRLSHLDITTQTVRVDAADVHLLRDNLADYNQQFTKTHPQSAFSHIIDAAMAYAAWECTEGVGITPEYLDSLLPEELRIQQVKSKPVYRKKNPAGTPLFKDSYISANFVPFYITAKGIAGFGFSDKNILAFADSSGKKKSSSKSAEDVYSTLSPFFVQSGTSGKNEVPVPETLEEVKSMAAEQKKSICLFIDKTKAVDFLHKAAKSPISSSESFAADILDSIAYYTRKKEIQSFLLDKGKVKSKEKIKDDIVKKTSTKIDIQGVTLSGSIIELPIRKEWEIFLEKSGFFGKFASGETVANEKSEEMKTLLREYFLGESNAVRGKNAPGRAHKKVRKVFSMPLVESTGSIAFIKRKDPQGKPVWQISDTHCAYEGFYESFNSRKYLNVFEKSPNVHIIGARFKNNENLNTCLMDDWKRLTIPEEIRDQVIDLEIMPGQSSRRYVRLNITFDTFRKLMNDPNLDWHKVDSSVKIPGDFKAILPGIGSPRNYIRIFNVSAESIQFTYETDFPAALAAGYFDEEEK